MCLEPLKQSTFLWCYIYTHRTHPVGGVVVLVISAAWRDSVVVGGACYVSCFYFYLLVALGTWSKHQTKEQKNHKEKKLEMNECSELNRYFFLFLNKEVKEQDTQQWWNRATTFLLRNVRHRAANRTSRQLSTHLPQGSGTRRQHGNALKATPRIGMTKVTRLLPKVYTLKTRKNTGTHRAITQVLPTPTPANEKCTGL